MSRGRRREVALSPLALCLALVSLFASTARAAVLGIDFGTLHIKAALIKPGVPLDIVLTKDSKRKEVAAIAFKPHRDEKNQIVTGAGIFPERAYGGDALALQGRFPSEVFPNLKHLLGLPVGEAAEKTIQTYQERYPALKVEQSEELGTTVLRSSGFTETEIPFTVEELIGMELANIKRNAQALAGKGSSVDDTVITVPPFYTADERRAIVRAAELAGLKINAVISDGLAVGLDYAKTRTFPEVTKGEKPEYHLVFDMGAGSTSATLLRFQGRSVKDVGRYNKTVQEVAVLGAGWDRTLGGDSLNHVIMERYVSRLMEKPDVKKSGITIEEVKANGRAMGRFFKEAEKARQILSANSETSSGFEEILPDIDLRTKLSRTEFEELVADFADRVEQPIMDALAMAKLSIKDVSSIILHGGAVRTPFVQARLEKIVGDAGRIRNSVNADESAVFGAAFKAAGLSASFKVKEIRDSDIAAYTTSLVYTDKGREKRQSLFVPSSQWGSGATTKQVSFKDKEDFQFSFVQSVDGVDRSVLKVDSVNLTLSVQELNRKFECEKEDISTKVSVRLSSVNGLPEIVGATVSCEVEGSAKSAGVGDTVKDWLGFGKKKDQEPLGEDDSPVEEVDANASASSSKTKSATSSGKGSSSSGSAKTPEPPKKRVETINVHVVSTAESGDQTEKSTLTRILERLTSFDASDLARLAREEALNLLESFTYYVRDVLENTDYESVSTPAQRDEISKLLQSTKEWMDIPGGLAKATREVLKGKRDDLKKLVDPIVSRRKESQTRPEIVKKLKESLDQAGVLLLQVESSIESALKAQSSAVEYEKSKSTSTETPASSASDDFADLDEPESETTAAPAPKYSDPSDFNPYSKMDISGIKSTYESVKSWLSEKETAQSALQPFDEPALRVKDLEAKAGQLSEAIRDLVYKQMNAAKTSSSSSKRPKTSKTKSSKKAKSTASSATATEETPAERASIIIDDEASASLTPTDEAQAAEKKKFGADVSIEELLGGKDEL